MAESDSGTQWVSRLGVPGDEPADDAMPDGMKPDDPMPDDTMPDGYVDPDDPSGQDDDGGPQAEAAENTSEGSGTAGDGSAQDESPGPGEESPQAVESATAGDPAPDRETVSASSAPLSGGGGQTVADREPPAEDETSPEAAGVRDAATRGRLEISERAVRRIAEQAAAEETGRRRRPAGLEGLRGGRSLPHASAEVIGRHTRLRIDIASAGDRSLPELAHAVRDHVSRRVGELTGMTVDVVDVHVDRLAAPAETMPTPVLAPAKRPARPGPARAIGFVLALVFIVAGGVGIYDAMVGLDLMDGDELTVQLLEWLDGLQPETWMIPVGIIAGLLGLWLVLAAVWPRPRRSLPLAADTGVYVTRRAVEALVTDTAGQHPGVVKARAKARRRAVKLRARVDGDGGTDAEIRSAVADRIDRLARPFRVRTSLRVERRPS